MLSPIPHLNILLVEDNLPDAILIAKHLSKIEKPRLSLCHVSTCREAVRCLEEEKFDVILLDLSLPDSFQLDTVKKISAEAENTAIIILTGLDDEKVALDSLREGAQDYLVKNEINSTVLKKAICYAIERKKQVRHLKHLVDILLDSNRKLEDYARQVSHDLKQPLQTILGSGKLIGYLEENAGEKTRQLLNMLVNSAEKMSDMIEALLSACRVGGEDEKEWLDCERIIKEVLELLGEQIRAKGAKITINFPAKFRPVMVYYNRVQLERVWQNLISNAIKYVPEDRKPEVAIAAEKHQNQWLFMISDNGIGIKETDYEKVFLANQRLSEGEKMAKGSGMGLAICKQIIEDNGGRIWVQSSIYQGSTFFFTIPTRS
ncbi:MAG: hybrid sensor histidine kinase/response regulator [Geminocystis sp.]|nr:hybrid sensor histidine kinase/response regulator [Geminocystis sp.]HIK38468.1 hybrid sensor histidine kinase/response regulator [Geminocystis sp. M7585_C2015_104]